MKMIQNTLIALVAALVSSSYALEPLEDSSEAYEKRFNHQAFSKLDKNNDGLFKPEEDPDQWRRKKGLDKNSDGAIDPSEMSKVPLKYVNNPGKQIRNVLFKKTPTGDVYLDFYFPDVDKNKQKPVVLYTHGGGWAAGSKHGAGNASFGKVHQALLKEGFCVVSVGYRLVSQERGTAMRDCVLDAQDALRFISAHREELGIDPMKIYTFGDSAGGHLAQMVLLAQAESLAGDPELAQYQYKTVAGVSWYGPCDFEDPQLFNHDGRENFRDRFGARIMGSDTGPQDKLERYREISPVNYLSEDGPALLMIQGDKDTTIPVKQAYRMQEALKTIEAPVEILIIKNAGHNWRSVDAPIEPGRGEIENRTVQFFLKHK